MTVRVGRRLGDAAEAYATTLRSPALRRAQLAFGAAWTADWAFIVTIGVVAHAEGGAAAVGLVAMLRTLPAAVLVPFAAAIADRVARDRVLVWSSLLRAAATGGVAVLLVADAAIWTVYALAVASTMAVTPYRAAHSALLPSLCTTPQQLTASNVVRGSLDSVALLLGPLASAALLAQWSPAAVFAAAAAVAVWSAWLMARVDYEAPPAAGPAVRRRILAETADGVRALLAAPDLCRIFAIFAAQTFTRGALTVLTVVVAIDLLGIGDPGVGLLTAALGAGAVVGSVGATALVAGRVLARSSGLAVAMWGAPLLLIAVWPEKWPSALALAAIGAANAVLDAGGFTVMARLASNEVLARVFGLFESMVAATVALGAIVTPAVIEVAGIRGALVVVGLVGPAACALAWRELSRIDGQMVARDTDIAVLQDVPMLRPLPVTTIERIASRAERIAVPAGTDVIRQGDEGDRYYVIVAGEVEVTQDGHFLRHMGAGEGFGEIALLRTVRRTTTVTSRAPLELLAIARDDFVPAVTGYAPSAVTATATVEERLARRPVREGVTP